MSDVLAGLPTGWATVKPLKPLSQPGRYTIKEIGGATATLMVDTTTGDTWVWTVPAEKTRYDDGCYWRLVRRDPAPTGEE